MASDAAPQAEAFSRGVTKALTEASCEQVKALTECSSEAAKALTELSLDQSGNILSTILDEKLLRGVGVEMLLRKCGNAFRGNESNPSNYAKSCEMSSLDDFISHDWGSSSMGKFVALCLIYNGWPAAVVSLLVGILLAALQSKYVAVLPAFEPSSGTTPVPYWCQVICPVVHVLVFFFWQDVRVALRLGTKSAFLDKYCIDQTDGKKKAAGILGLGGFLRHTNRFVVCWTPRYFTRLWCTYEVASWLFLDKPMSSVVFMPLSHAQCLASVFLGSTGVCILFAFGSYLFPSWYLIVLGVALSIQLPISMHFLRRFMHEIRMLPQQVYDFSIKNAACFCCTYTDNHEKPKVKITCDRKLVYRTVATWFPATLSASMSDSVENPFRDDTDELLAFDKAVRNLFGPWLVKSAGPTQLRYKYIVLIAMPFAFRMLDVAATIGKNTDVYVFKMLVGLYPATVLAIMPIAYKAALHITCWSDRLIGLPTQRWVDLLATLLLATVIMILIAILWVPITLCAETLEAPLPTFVIVVILYVVLGIVFADEVVEILPARYGGVHMRTAPRNSKGERETPLPPETDPPLEEQVVNISSSPRWHCAQAPTQPTSDRPEDSSLCAPGPLWHYAQAGRDVYTLENDAPGPSVTWQALQSRPAPT